MRLKISHRTNYAYASPINYALQRLRLRPPTGQTQTVQSWSITLDGAKEEVQFVDHFGNDTRLVSASGDARTISVLAEGEVDTVDTAGVVGHQYGLGPLWLYQSPTPLTQAGKGIARLVKSVESGADLARLHGLMAAVGQRVKYLVGSTDATTTAEKALEAGKGVCQDHAHVFIAAARSMGFPARYVSGYLLMKGQVDQVASHAWAEAHVEGLGWVGFDAANDMSPDEHYVRLAVGRDYREAMPVSGILLSQNNEHLDVKITVEQ